MIGAYHKCVAETIRRFDGFVAKYMGDGVLVYFGYPRAHEDDAERAIRAALDCIHAVARLDLVSIKLQARIGIATGLVVVGDLIGEGSAQEQSVVGETPNLAARLQALAEPETVVIAASTRRLVGNLFELRDLRARRLKGFAEPERVWQVLSTSGVDNRFEALRTSALTPLVGREDEIELLWRRWGRAKAGEGQIVLLAGEAGIGKSRVLAAFGQRLQSERHTSLRFFCSPHHQDSTLYPVIARIERAARFARHDTAETKLAGVDAGQELNVRGARGDEKELAELPIAGKYRWVPGEVAPDSRYNIAQLHAKLAESIRNVKPVTPGFDAAVTRHRLLDAIFRASETGTKQRLES